MPEIRVKYTCQGCGVDQAPVSVPERGPGEHAGAWVRDVVMPLIAVDHAMRSPGCGSSKCDLRIPMPLGDGRLGEVDRQ